MLAIGCAVRAEIIANIYEKALKRSDFSGAATKDGEKQKDGEHATGADLGKIVQIMSSASAQRCSAKAHAVQMIHENLPLVS